MLKGCSRVLLAVALVLAGCAPAAEDSNTLIINNST